MALHRACSVVRICQGPRAPTMWERVKYALIIYPSLVDHFTDEQLQSILPDEFVVITILRVCSLGPRGNEFTLRAGRLWRGIDGRRGSRRCLCKGDETLLESESFGTFGKHFDAPTWKTLLGLVARRRPATPPASSHFWTLIRCSISRHSNAPWRLLPLLNTYRMCFSSILICAP